MLAALDKTVLIRNNRAKNIRFWKQIRSRKPQTRGHRDRGKDA